MKFKDTIIEHNRNSNKTVLFLQGGPSNRLLADPKVVREKLPKSAQPYHYIIELLYKKFLKKFNFVQVKQIQNLKFLKKLSKNCLEKLHKENMDMLQKAIVHYKNKGHKVVVVGHSYGAYILKEYMAKYNTENIDLAILGNSRLITPESISYNIYNKSSWVWFDEKGREGKIEKYKDTINMKFLHAYLCEKDYTKVLKDVKLPKTILISGNGDKWLGNISKREIHFIKNKDNFKLIHHNTWYIKFIKPVCGNATIGEIGHHTLFSPLFMLRLKKIINNI